jgi:hypothetical protein
VSKIILDSFVVVFIFVGLLIVAQEANAYPEFQRYIQVNSGRFVDCSMCHTHPEGPAGSKRGQIGRLDKNELLALAEARLAFQPNTNVENPVLNKFGNLILKTLGKTEILKFRQNPELLGSKMPKESDLDEDGVSDIKEMYLGTHPLDKTHGPPWLLFKSNFKKHAGVILALILAMFTFIYAINLLQRVMGKNEQNAD